MSNINTNQKIDTHKAVILKILKQKVKTEKELASLKRKLAKKSKISLPSNIDLLKTYRKLLMEKKIKKSKFLENLLKKRPVRSLSGIVSLSLLTSPSKILPKNLGGQALSCPGKCIFCPTESGIPKSYLSGEPAVERAKKLKFDPYLQVKKRIEMLKNQGHLVDKIELRIIGGSWSNYPKRYQNWFIKKCFDACNNGGRRNGGRNGGSQTPTSLWESDSHNFYKDSHKGLAKAQKINEEAKHRIVGLSIETRPDFINEKEIKWLRKLGVTMVELGVQTIFDDILKYSQTGQKTDNTIKATRLLKDAGFKVMYQMMPNLPKSTVQKDKKVFKEIFENRDFKPDWLKIYPCLVLKTAGLYKLWKNGKYKSYSCKKLISLIKYIKSICPYWTRITRIYRDIAKEKIVSGCKISNLREIIQKEMKKENIACRCIRCREVKEKYNPKEKIYLFREDYDASKGKEIFLSFEVPKDSRRDSAGRAKNRKKLYSFLRLRIPSQIFEKKKHFLPVLQNSAIIRELHTYGPMISFGKRGISPQHRGLGKKLIKEAEKIIKKEFKLNKVAVISGVGARKYYSSLGYRLRETYMVKYL